jgi:ubiquinone biosynthesis protein
VVGRLKEAGEGAELFGRLVSEVPRLLERAESTAIALADMARGGFRLDEDTVERLAAAQARHSRWSRLALWVGALALAAAAAALWLMLPVG